MCGCVGRCVCSTFVFAVSGNLNILPHKSWNVYSAKNREKVAKDEAEYAQELKRESDRLALVNAEKRRTTLLSRRAAVGGVADASGAAASLPAVDARVTLVEAFTQAPPTAPAPKSATNHLLADRPNFLHDVKNEKVPFYMQPAECGALPDEEVLVAKVAEASRHAQSLRTPAHIAASIVQESNAQLARLQRLQAERDQSDPMAAMVRPKSKKKARDRSESSSERSSSSDSSHKKRKKQRKSKRKAKLSNSDVERLRAERLAREAESRQRVQALIVGERVPASQVNATARRSGFQ